MVVMALIDKDGNVVNRVAWDGETPWAPPPGLRAVRDEERVSVIGGSWDGKTFQRPPEPEEGPEEPGEEAEEPE
jgi:hypothetical protein